MSAFHYATNAGNFGRKSNGNVRFRLVRPEYSEPGLWSSRWPTLTGRTGRIEICRSISTKRFIALLLFSRFHLCRERNENGTSHSSWLAQFDRKMSFHFSSGIHSHWSLTGRSGIMESTLCPYRYVSYINILILFIYLFI